MHRIFLIAIMLVLVCFLNAELLNYNKVITNSEANKKYKENDFSAAQEKYQSNAIKHPEEGALHYNLGNSLYKQNKIEDAEAEYKMAMRDQNFTDLSSLYHNMGNIKFQQQDYKNALEYYKKSLVSDPSNINSRYNYELAARYLQKQQEQQQQQNKDQDNKDEKKDQNKQQQQQQQDQDKDKKEEQQKQQQDGEDKKEQQQQNIEKTKDEKEAEQVLKAILAKEKEELKKEKEKKTAERQKSGKYW